MSEPVRYARGSSQPHRRTPNPEGSGLRRVKLASRSLSSGGKAGVGVGVTLIILILLAAGWFYLRRRRSRKQETDAEAHNTTSAPAENTFQERLAKMPGIGKLEMPAKMPKVPGAAVISDLRRGLSKNQEAKDKPPTPPEKSPRHTKIPLLGKFELPRIPVGAMLSGPPTAVTSKPGDRPFLPELGDGQPAEPQKDYGWPSEPTSNTSDLSPPAHFVEMDSNQQPESERKDSGSVILPIQRPPPLHEELPESPIAPAPETQVSIHPGPVPPMSASTATLPAPTSEEELLAAKHAQLEETRRRIEREQAALEEKMKALHGQGASTL